MDVDALSARLTAVASPPRLRILAVLGDGPLHVSEIARRVGMSRPLLYMHLTKLEENGYVSGHLELSPDGRALKVFEIQEFSITVDLAAIRAAVDEPGPEPET
ncbi:winged helix-turn-helix domain-containing protein [Actinotalea sp. K2]|uniref:ArsR/SmtB family transcription factor n=1 Tax=Actinotalea sp. K2 TaxID=2939438 RepID=UPI00201776FD|nr:winged helix-turn-helix domain-containing protein [Actinotalea sp. K2]MCL3862816.1 winged helix-turn-helix domain-containing protein [Actinotalea sp. K2]